ncbi:hypothetical protein NPIL_510721 [Nephila pilipes]|uniref:Uncharacterized protein n=1 Tax=Nephila pilipes TaxID=299642 RepID=A0A8X6TXY8_NEPPI|nr:hypothetical protein NPIL_510721 [Nephila pilipes]
MNAFIIISELSGATAFDVRFRLPDCGGIIYLMEVGTHQRSIADAMKGSSHANYHTEVSLEVTGSRGEKRNEVHSEEAEIDHGVLRRWNGIGTQNGGSYGIDGWKLKVWNELNVWRK